jgi:hypothetical protein
MLYQLSLLVEGLPGQGTFLRIQLPELATPQKGQEPAVVVAGANFARARPRFLAQALNQKSQSSGDSEEFLVLYRAEEVHAQMHARIEISSRRRHEPQREA